MGADNIINHQPTLPKNTKVINILYHHLNKLVKRLWCFKKPNKTGSVLHDTLAMENGDDTITCSALNIDGNRVGTERTTEWQGLSNVYKNTQQE